ncbi:MAG: hypothetical protein P8188_04995 [Gemmatimonadota bacterium]|jgi:hypothetical protein
MSPSRPSSETSSGETGSLRFSPVNAVLGLAGLASLVAGYWLLSSGSITLAPLLLVLAYVVLLPLAIIK